jgi:succinate dehydrogenase flavin-adding protein (antitoxin of CptAB toxin-antitoxin module)
VELDGAKFNPETNAADLRRIPFRFSRGLLMNEVLDVTAPHYIARYITPSEVERMTVLTEAELDRQLVRWVARRPPIGHHALRQIARVYAYNFVCEFVYNLFCEKMRREGQEAWAVPETLQRTIFTNKGGRA